MIAYAQNTATEEIGRIAVLLDNISSIINILVAIAVSLVFLYFFWKVGQFILAGDATYEKLKREIIWSVIAIFLLVSIWGIINLLQNILFPTQAGSGVQYTNVFGTISNPSIDSICTKYRDGGYTAEEKLKYAPICEEDLE